MENRKNILVTGGAGYIGSHTVVELFNAGYNPVILDDFRNSKMLIINRIKEIIGEKIDVFTSSCQDESNLREIFTKYNFDGVIHFAADKAVGESVLNPLKYYDNNINSLISILRMVEEFKTKGFVFSSSCSVYGNPKNASGKSIVTEDSIDLNPDSPYGNTKLICEQIIQQWLSATGKSNVSLLRYFNPIGAHESGMIGELPQGIPNNLLPYITQTAVGLREKLTVFGNDYDTVDGTCVRDYIHVVDLAKAHVAAIQWVAKEKPGVLEVFNIGTGKGKSVLDIIQTFEATTGKSLNWEFGERRAGDVPEIFADPSKAERILNWKSELSVEEAITDSWKWEQNIFQDV
jgi:UDP-glucose 4-epimerase